MYESFYRLREKPFSIVSDPSVLYLSDHHQRALTYLEYGLMENAGYILLTGAVGTGKTTLVRYVLENLAGDMEVAVVFNTNLSAKEFIDFILQSYNLEQSGDSKRESIELFNRFLTAKHAENRKVLLIIDEAQNLSDDVLEEVRLLSNLQIDNELLLHVMLVGQPELKKRLRQPTHIPLSQRIAVNFFLAPLSKNEVQDYISFRIEKVGGRPDLFEPDAVALIYRESDGIPRTINLLCDAALVYGFGYDLETINASVIEQVIKDRGGLGSTPEVGSGTRASSPQQAAGDGLEVLNRLGAVETQVRDLEMKMEWYAEQMMQRAGTADNHQLLKLKKLLVAERRRTDLLKMDNQKLLKRMEEIETALREDIETLEDIVLQDDVAGKLRAWLDDMRKAD